jgi:hypothetical protein
MAFAKLKALLNKAAARSVDELSDAIAQILDAFTPQECENDFVAAEYDRHPTCSTDCSPPPRGGLLASGDLR